VTTTERYLYAALISYRRKKLDPLGQVAAPHVGDLSAAEGPDAAVRRPNRLFRCFHEEDLAVGVDLPTCTKL
jgi:hypothetical protein